MNTFLPYPSFQESAKCLDNKRLVKQNLETKQILNTLCGFSEGWKNHPAVLAWKGYIWALAHYGLTINTECVKKGFKDNKSQYQKYLIYCIQNKIPEEIPKWFGDETFHSSHRSRLLCKGEIDALCVAIKKHFKFKKIDNWCKENFKLTKNQLKFEHIALLYNICLDNSIQAGANFYKKYGWKDDPSKSYIWPTKSLTFPT